MSIRIQTVSESGRRMDTFMEIFTLVTGLVYIVLEIRQKNFMWVVGVATSLAAIYTFWNQHLYASMILNVYYFCISFWGLYQWRKDAGKLAAGTVVLTGGNSRDSGSGMPDLSGSEAGPGNKPGNGSIGKCDTFPDHAGENVDRIHLTRLGWRTVTGCCVFFIGGLALLKFLLVRFGDPMSGLDAAVAVLSAVATYMLSRSYLEQWLLWIVADIMSTVLCATQGLYWMAALYALYTASAVYGYMYWRKNGIYVD